MTTDEYEINQISAAFTDALSAICNEAAIIRQLSSLQITSGIESEPSLCNDENLDPNSCDDIKKSKAMNQTEIQRNMIQQLNGIHSVLSQIESKVSSLAQVLQEEQSAIKTLHQLKESALGQRKVIQDIKQNLADQELYDILPGNQLLKMGFELDSLGLLEKKQRESLSMESTPKVSQETLNTDRPVNTETPSSTNMAQKYRTPGSIKSSRHVMIPLRFISKDEFNSVSKNIRGRITLSALNEALLDIQRVTENKYNILHHSNRKNSSASKISYQETCALHKEMLINLIQKDVPFVTEQELRDSCAFFRSGESTARAILQILRSCKRIKQVFLGNSGVGIGGGSVGILGDRSNGGSLVAYLWLDAAKEE
jgi:hypothetical protein